MSSLKLYGSTSGYVEVVPEATAGNNSVTLPNGSGTLLVKDASGNIEVGTGVTIAAPSSNTFTVSTNGSERIRVDSSGRLGIGATSPESGGKLTVNGGLFATSFLTASATDAAAFDFVNDGRGTRIISYGPDGSTKTAISFSQGVGGGSASEVGRFDSSGRLLVGTTSARGRYTLQLEGNSESATDVGELWMGRPLADGSIGSGTGLGKIYFGGQSGGVGAKIEGLGDAAWGTNDYPSRLVFSTTNDSQSSPTARVRLTSRGFLKCSPRVDDATHGAQRVSSPTHEFTADDNDWVVQMTHTSGSAAESSGLYIKYRSTSPNNGSAQFFYAADSTTVRAAFNSNGGLANYSANNSNLCDEREKKNIVNLDSTWDCLKHWEVKKFHYNEDLDTDDLRYGVIAQQVAEYCPEVITDWIKPAMEAVLDEEGNEITPAREEVARIGVKEQQMMWMAIKSLQEAQTRIETLEAEVAALKNP